MEILCKTWGAMNLAAAVWWLPRQLWDVVGPVPQAWPSTPSTSQSISVSNKTGFPELLLALTGFALALRQNRVVER